MIEQFIINTFVFFVTIEALQKAGVSFNYSNFILKYIVGINCYSCFSIRIASAVQVVNYLCFDNFNLIAILATYIFINLIQITNVRN